MTHSIIPIHTASLALVVLATASCQSSSYTSALKTSSADHKSTLLASAEASREEHAPVQGQFQSTYQVFGQLVRHEGEDQQAVYDGFANQLDVCAEHAARFHGRTAELREEAAEFFEAWGLEMAQFSSPGMRGHSEDMLEEARQSLDDLVAQLDRTHDQMQVVLLAWRDYVLFFSHNLNRHALDALDDENEDFDETFEDLDEAFAESRARLENSFQVLEGR